MRDLESLCRGMDLLATEVGQGLVPLPQALRRAARGMASPAASILSGTAQRMDRGEGTVQEAWRAALEASQPQTALRDADLDILRALGTVLGRSLSQDQVRHLELTRKRLEASASAARQEAERGEKLRVYLGILGSVALVIIFW